MGRAGRVAIVTGLALAVSALGLPGTAHAAPGDPSTRSITVSPSTGLVSGASVDVHWTGFPPGGTAVLQCAAGVTVLLDCDLNSLQIVQTPADGTFDATIVVQRTIRLGVNTLRCSDAPDSCAIAVGNVSDQTQYESQTISFDPSAPLPSPSVSVEPDDDLVDQQSVEVAGAGFRPGSELQLTQCAAEVACFTPAPSVTVGATGSFTTTFVVDNRVHGTVSCLETPCTLRVADPADAEYDVVVPLGFDPAGPPPSVRMIRVTPNTQLTDRQVVTVTGTGYDPMAQVAVAQCASSAPLQCAPGTSGFTVVDAAGTFSVEVRVRRLVAGVGPGDVVDCAPTGCEIRALSFNEPPSGAPAALEFDPAVPPAPPPTISANPTTDLGYRESITVQGEGFTPGAPVFLSQCGNDPEGQFGLCIGGAGLAADASGAFTGTLVARRFLGFEPGGDAIDCAAPAASCVLQMFGDDLVDVVEIPLTFDLNAAVPPPPTLAVDPATGLANRQPVTVNATGLAPGDSVTLLQCTSGNDPFGDLCSGFQPATADASGNVTTPFTVRRTVSDGFSPPVDCAAAPGTCWVSITGSAGGPEHAEAPLSFDPDAPVPPPPTLVATPSVGLSDGQTVSLHGSGFSPNAPIGFALCADGALSLNRCDIGRARFATADADGNFDGEFPVTPTISTAEGEFDCGTAPGACFLGAANTSDFTENGRAPVSFGPEISVEEVTVTNDTAIVTVALSRASERQVQVHWATVDGSAVAPADYLSGAGDLVFAPGETTKTITVAVVPGRDHDQDREFSVQLSTPQAASLAPDTAQAAVTLVGAPDHHHGRDCDRHDRHHHHHHGHDDNHDHGNRDHDRDRDRHHDRHHDRHRDRH